MANLAWEGHVTKRLLAALRYWDFEKQAITFLLLLVFVNGMVWALAVPIWQSPDEPSHFGAMAFIAERGRLPASTDVFISDEIALSMVKMQTNAVAFRPKNRQDFSATLVGPGEEAIRSLPAASRRSVDLEFAGSAMHLPPLYYLLGAGIYRLAYSADILARVLAVRAFSVLLLASTVLVSYHTMRLAFPRRPEMRWTVPVLVGCQPMFTHLGSVVNTDVLVIFFFSLLLYLGVRIARVGLTVPLALTSGVVLGSVVLTKPHALSVVPVLGLALILRLLWQPGSRRRILARALLIPAATLLTCGWWLLRNLGAGRGVLYTTQHKAQDLQPSLSIVHYLDHYRESLTQALHRSYWAQFGWLDTRVSPVYYRVLMGITVVAAFGLLVYWFRVLRRRQPARQTWYVALLTVGALSLLVGWAVVGFIFTRRTGFFMPRQGRYFLPSLVANSALLALGLLTPLPRWLKPWGHRALRVGAIVFNVVCLWGFVVPRYYL
jgi:4-amino-4-deoxy-L-arabinose transferase-like glycosyltransferase